MRDRLEGERGEEENLAPCASRSGMSRGRVHPEEEHPYRTIYMRDRDRIIHSQAFRRLEYKTQVFVYHEGDHYRTRLTHTLEVAQIARSMARALRLNEDLCEAIALSHDMGHPPFGHSGERALDELMKNDGGFEHNLHTLRIVDHIEHRYPGFRGVNLSWETREAIAKHSRRKDHPSVQEFMDTPSPSLEAQVVDLADAIAYNSHDLDDGLESGLLDVEELCGASLFKRFYTAASSIANMTRKLVNHHVIRKVINAQVGDAVRQTENNIRRFRIASPDDARAIPEKVADFSADMRREHNDLKSFLKKNMYQHYRVIRMEEKAYNVVSDLFRAYDKRKELLPTHVQRRFDDEDKRRLICDYIAGMTDRFAMDEHRKLFDPVAKVWP